MMQTHRITPDEFWPLVENRQIFSQPDTLRFSDTIGFHVYADLRLNLDLAAAEDARSASKYIDLLEDFTAIAEKCAVIVGANILEVQGDRIHFLLPESEITTSSILKLLLFSSSLTRMAYAELKSSAKDDWQGFYMAADHGMAVLVPSNFGGGSVVSLGNAANQPAKRLGRGVPSGYLALPKRLGHGLPGGKQSGEWILFDVNTPSAETLAYFDEALTGRMRSAAKAILEERSRRGMRSFVDDLNEGIILSQTPIRTRGMCLRADLDGFTKSVEEAFRKGPTAVLELVKRFREIMEYPYDFARKIDRPLIEVPWAGDCCTIFIKPAFHESVEEMRASLPVEAGRHWHGVAYENGNGSPWRVRMGSARWAVGLACGDREEGGDGCAIITEFSACGRSYRVLAGWCARRAKDAQETDGLGEDAVVIPNVDYRNLEDVLRPLFSEVGSLFRSSDYTKLKNAGKTVSKPLAISTTSSVAVLGTPLPKPRPYWPPY